MSGVDEQAAASGACPDLEDLAAFVEGRLAGPGRRRMVEHLDRCERCYEVFTETVRSREEERPAGRLVEHPGGRRRWPRWAVAAAAAAALVLAWPLRQALLRPGGLTAELRVERLADHLLHRRDAPSLAAAIYDGAGWSRVRGAYAAGLDERRRSFRLGVRVVDLEVALRAGDAGRAVALLPEIVDLAASFELSEAVATAYREVSRRLEAGEAPRDLLELSGQAAGYAAEFGDPDHFALGKWAEAGRLAAATGNRGFFRGEAVAVPERLAEAALEGPVSDAAGEISARLRAGLAHDDLPDLAARLTRLVEIGANR